MKEKIKIVFEGLVVFLSSIIVVFIIENYFHLDFLQIGGLFFNFLGAFVLVIPLLRFEEQFHKEKDKLIDCGKKGEEQLYTTERKINNVKLAVKGLALIMSGFMLQLLAHIF